MKKYDVYAMGNALVDFEFALGADWLEKAQVEKGVMTLVDQDKQAQLRSLLEKDNISQIKKQCGGSAANTVIGLSSLGGNAFYSCKVASDDDGNFYLNDLVNHQVANSLKDESLDEGVTGKCFVFVTPDADRTMNTFLGATSSYSLAQSDFESLSQSEWLYIEGYLVASETAFEACVETLKKAKELGVKTSLTLSDPNMVKFFKEKFNTLLEIGIDLLFCNGEEAIELTGATDEMQAIELLQKQVSEFVMTVGSKGAYVFDQELIHVDAPKVEAKDTNGAGDLFAGAYLYGINHELSPKKSASLAIECCAKLVTQYGPRLEKETLQQIKTNLLG